MFSTTLSRFKARPTKPHIGPSSYLLLLPKNTIIGHGTRSGINGLSIRHFDSLIVCRINKPSLVITLATIKTNNIT